MTGDDRLRIELEALERAAPIAQLPATDSSPARRWRKIGLIGVTVVAAVAVTSLAFGLGRLLDVGSRSSSPDPSGPPANPPAVAETRVGDFILTISSPKTIWTADEVVEVTAALRYVGDEPDMTIRQGNPPIGFTLAAASGDGPTLVGNQEQPCLAYAVSASDPLVQAYRKGGPISEDGIPLDEAPPFDRAFLDDPELRLPPGEWRFTALTSFDERGCGSDYQLEVSIILHVVAPPSQPVPSTEVTPEPSEPEPSATPQVRACAAALAHGTLGADADGNPILIIQDDLPPASIVFSYPEDFVIDSAPMLTIYDRDSNVLAREGDEVELGGGFNAGDTIFHACSIHQVLPGGATVECGLASHECEVALSAFGQLFDLDDPGLDNVAVTVGRGLAWHAEVHACWVDGRYVLVDVLGDRYGPTDDLRMSVRPDGWIDPPCQLSEARLVPGQPLSSASEMPR